MATYDVEVTLTVTHRCTVECSTESRAIAAAQEEALVFGDAIAVCAQIHSACTHSEDQVNA
jgi:hypothetical protein